ncbi:MAG: hypothetical protein Fur0032_17050 [Terrimicrobiaceae bacterium]
MVAQIDAVVRLLKDGDPDTVRLVKEQFVHSGNEYLHDLEELVERSDSQVSCHLRDILETIRHREREEDFELLCRFFHDSSDVEPALWQLATVLDPESDIEGSQFRVEQWGRRFSVKIGGAISSRERVIALSEFMADELSFRGNEEDYYNPKNSLLPRVVDTRSGIPISLVLLYRMVALRAGMIVDGINLPGHFIARHADVLFDPFHRGRVLTRPDIEGILRRQGLRLKSCHLYPASPRQILTRILANLTYSYDLAGDCHHRSLTDHWVRILTGSPA